MSDAADRIMGMVKLLPRDLLPDLALVVRGMDAARAAGGDMDAALTGVVSRIKALEADDTDALRGVLVSFANEMAELAE